MALTGAWVDEKEGLLSMIVLEMGGSSRLCAALAPGEPVVVMGPTGTPTEIPAQQSVVLCGGGLGNAVLFSIARAMRDANIQTESTILFVADVVGQPGRDAVKAILPGLKREVDADLTILNGENSAGGFGVTGKLVAELRAAGADVITTGNHVFAQKEFVSELPALERVIRPANYPPQAPGQGWCVGYSCSSPSRTGLSTSCKRGRRSAPARSSTWRPGSPSQTDLPGGD